MLEGDEAGDITSLETVDDLVEARVLEGEDEKGDITSLEIVGALVEARLLEGDEGDITSLEIVEARVLEGEDEKGDITSLETVEALVEALGEARVTKEDEGDITSLEIVESARETIAEDERRSLRCRLGEDSAIKLVHSLTTSSTCVARWNLLHKHSCAISSRLSLTVVDVGRWCARSTSTMATVIRSDWLIRLRQRLPNFVVPRQVYSSI